MKEGRNDRFEVEVSKRLGKGLEWAVTQARRVIHDNDVERLKWLLLTRIWPVPDDLPHAAGMGNLSRVKHWFDKSGAPAPGDLESHYPYNDARARGHLQWDPPRAQQVLDVALAFSVINRHSTWRDAERQREQGTQ